MVKAAIPRRWLPLYALTVLLPPSHTTRADIIEGKEACPRLLAALAPGETYYSYTQRPGEFFHLVRENTDPKRELSSLQQGQSTIRYGEFFGASEIEHVFKRLSDWRLWENPSPAQRDFLANYLVLRAHGLKKGRTDALVQELLSGGISLKRHGKDVTVEAIDLAIADAGTVENAKRIRVFPLALIDKADTTQLPQATVVFHGDQNGKDKPIDLQSRQKDRERVNALRDSGEGTLLIGDLHLFRGEAENRAFERLLKELKRRPPKKIVLGGDIVDSPGLDRSELPRLAGELEKTGALPVSIQAELARLAQLLAQKKELPEILREPSVQLRPGSRPPAFTTESAAKIRFALAVLELKRIKEALPETDVSFVVGNHDIPRLEFLGRQGSQDRIDYSGRGGAKKQLQMPHVLALQRGELKQDAFLKALAEANPGISIDALKAEATNWFPAVKKVFGIKGSSLANLPDHRHYDLAFADWFKQRNRDFGVTTLVTDPAAPSYIGDTALVHEPIMLTRDTEKTPNLLRVIEPSDNPYAVQPSLNELTRQVINFDQHVSAIIQRDGITEPSFTNILVGAFSASNSNPGQRYKAALIDPKTGRVHPITFFDSDAYFGDPESLGITSYRLAPATQLNYRTARR